MNSDNQLLLLKKVTGLFAGSHDFRDLATKAANLVAKELKQQNLAGAAIFRVHEQENLLYAYTYSHKFRRLIDPLLPVKFSELNVPLSSQDNLLVRTVLTNQIQESSSLTDFGRGALSETITGKIEKITRAKLWVSLPIRLKSGKAAAVVLFAILDSKLSGEQVALFEAFADQLGLAFSNVMEFERLLAKYQNLTSRFVASGDDAPSVKFTLRITPKENEVLERLAREQKRTKAEIIRDFLDQV